jgi:hypothetical protein
VADDEGFLGRWSRRKQAQKTAETAAQAPKPAPAAMEKAEEGPAAPEPVDLAKLPPIDTLGAESDFTAFLRPGVPQSMQIAALRRLWLTDPSVKNYEALVEYAWDFNAPGYGKMLPTDDVAKLLQQVFGPSTPQGGTAEAPPANVSEPPKIAAQNEAVRRSTGDISRPPSMPASDTAALLPPVEAPGVEPGPAASGRKRHGAALPRPPEGPQEG